MQGFGFVEILLPPHHPHLLSLSPMQLYLALGTGHEIDPIPTYRNWPRLANQISVFLPIRWLVQFSLSGVKDCTKLNSWDKRKIYFYLFFYLQVYVYETTGSPVVLGSLHESVRQPSLRRKPVSLMAEKTDEENTHKKTPQTKNRVLCNIVDPLDRILLKLRKPFEFLCKPSGVGFSNTCCWEYFIWLLTWCL